MPITSLIQDSHTLLLLVIASVALLESFAFIGLLIPGVAFLFTLATLAAQQQLPIPALLFAGFIGSFLGDGFSYLLGRHYSDRIIHSNPFKKYQSGFDKGVQFFSKYGFWGLLAGRFIGPLRPLLPFIAGTCKMPYTRYGVTNLICAMLWAPAYLLPGYAAGTALTEIDINWTIALESALVGFICLWLLNTSHNKLTSISQNAPWAAISLTLASTALFSIIVYMQLSQQWGEWNHSTFSLLQPDTTLMGTLISHSAQIITHLGDKLYIVIALLITLVWLIHIQNLRIALYFAAALLLNKLVNTVFKLTLSVPRPESGHDLSSYSFPSGHSSAGGALILLLAVLLLTGENNQHRKLGYLIALVLAGMLALSRVILGVHWPLDIIAGLLEALITAGLFRILLFYHHSATPFAKKSQLSLGLALFTLGYITISVWLF